MLLCVLSSFFASFLFFLRYHDEYNETSVFDVISLKQSSNKTSETRSVFELITPKTSRLSSSESDSRHDFYF